MRNLAAQGQRLQERRHSHSRGVDAAPMTGANHRAVGKKEKIPLAEHPLDRKVSPPSGSARPWLQPAAQSQPRQLRLIRGRTWPPSRGDSPSFRGAVSASKEAEVGPNFKGQPWSCPVEATRSQEMRR